MCFPVRKKYWVFIIALLTAFGANRAIAGSTSEVLNAAHLVGTWSVDCSGIGRGPSSYFTYTTSLFGSAKEEDHLSAAEYHFTYEVTSAERITNEKTRVIEKLISCQFAKGQCDKDRIGQQDEILWEARGDKILELEHTSGGHVIIKDGKLLSMPYSNPLPLYERCLNNPQPSQ